MPESEMERLLDTRAGKALAYAAWSEGAGAMLRACNAEGVWAKPENPYSAPLIAAIRESQDAPPRPPWIDPRACWAHCAPGWRVPCDDTESTDSTDPCPEWHCPDLSSEDRREGRTCPDHPCTCPNVQEPEHG